MQKHHPENEKVKWQYLQFLDGPKRRKAESIDQVAAAVAAFEASTNWKDFRLFHLEQARKFKRDLDSHIVAETGQPLAVSTKVSRLRAVKSFFQWLAGRPGYSRKLIYSDMEYFNPSNNDARIAGAVRERPIPSLEQIRHVLSSMPTATVVERRNRALLAFVILSGARDAATASICLKHVDIERRKVIQDAREVKTKNRKTFTSDFFPVGDDILAIIEGWISELREVHYFGPNDPVFPSTERGLDGNHQFFASGISRKHWSDAGPIRKIFQEAFSAAGLPYYNPHSFRKTIWKLGEEVCANGAEARAWSLNLGHENVLTSFSSYGPMTGSERGEIMARLSKRMPVQGLEASKSETDSIDVAPDPKTISQVLAYLQQHTP